MPGPKKGNAMSDILIYEDIGYGWTDYDGNDHGLTALSFNKSLSAVPSSELILNLRINSMGGLVSDGIAMFNSVRRFIRNRQVLGNPVTVNSYIEGFAYSSAATIAMSANGKVYMGKGTTLMIHNAAGFAWGDAKSMRQEADLLDKYNGLIAGFYADKSGMKNENVLSLMDSETYFSPEEAISAKLADAIDDSVVANFKLYEGDSQALNLKSQRGYDAYMNTRVRSRLFNSGKQGTVDKGEQSVYNKQSLKTLEVELELLEAELN